MATVYSLHATEKMDSIFVVLLCILPLFEGYVAESAKEYCNGERFRATCAQDGIVIMRSASIGRMKIGKCLKREFGHLGCSTDVLKHFDSKCSNKQQCEVVVSEVPVRGTATACPEDLTSYLETSFHCEKVLQFQCNTGPVTITGQTTVSSEILNQCASSKDVTFAAQPGQQLNISAIYFDWDQSSSSHCRQTYGRIQDSLSSNSASICAGRERDAQLMVSNGNMVDINLNGGADRGSFLLRFTVLGCGHMDAPVGGWVERDGNELTMGCHSGRHTWTLTCVHGRWQGATGQCGTGAVMAVSKPERQSSILLGLSPGIMVFAVCSVLIFLSAVIFTISVCVHTSRSQQPSAAAARHVLYDDQHHALTMHPAHFDGHQHLTGTLQMKR